MYSVLSHRIEETDAGQYPSHLRYLHVPGLEWRSGTSWPYEESTGRYCVLCLVQQDQAERHRVRLRDHDGAPFQLLLLLPFRSVFHLPHLPHRATARAGCIRRASTLTLGRRTAAASWQGQAARRVVTRHLARFYSQERIQNTAGQNTEYCAVPRPTRPMVYIPCPKGWPAWFARPRLRHLCNETSFQACKARLFLVSVICLARSFQRHCHPATAAASPTGLGICCMRSGHDEMHVMTFPDKGESRRRPPRIARSVS